jgi:ABC-2 type transport system permease protein
MSTKRILILTRYYLFSLKNNRLKLILLLTWSTFDLLVWGFTSSYFQQTNQPNLIITTLFSFVIWSLLWQFQSETSHQFLRDVHTKNFTNFIITPLSLKEIIFSLFLSSLVKTILVFSSISIFTYLVFSLNILIISYKFVFYILQLILFGWILGLLTIAIIIGIGKKASFLAKTLAFYLWPFLCVFYPRESLPKIFRIISYLFPPSYVFEQMRSASPAIIFSKNIIISTLMSLIYLLITSIVLKFMLETAKKNGNLSRI